MDYGESSFLFTGDVEEHALDTLASYYQGTASLDVDVYQVGHHGSYNGTNKVLLHEMSPSVAILSFGPKEVEEAWTAWAYGHPRQSLVMMLEASIERYRDVPKSVPVAPATKTFVPFLLQKSLYGTGWDGHVVVTANKAGEIVIKTTR